MLGASALSAVAQHALTNADLAQGGNSLTLFGTELPSRGRSVTSAPRTPVLAHHAVPQPGSLLFIFLHTKKHVDEFPRGQKSDKKDLITIAKRPVVGESAEIRRRRPEARSDSAGGRLFPRRGGPLLLFSAWRYPLRQEFSSISSGLAGTVGEPPMRRGIGWL